MVASERADRIRKSCFALAAVLSFAVGATAAQAQANWPQRPVTLIVSQSAGASPDVFARLISEKLHQAIGQPVIVENKPGAGNAIGAQAAARATPDGYTFFFATSAALTMNPFLMKNLPYDPLKDFVPVGLVTRSHQVLIAHPSFPAKGLQELIDVVKKEPGKYSVAIDGPRNLSGVIVRILKQQAGLDIVEVPYTNIPASLQDVVSGRLPVGMFSLSVADSQIRAGTVRAIAGASALGISSLPEVEPIAKTFPGFDYLGWFMVMAPKNTPEPIVNAMHKAIGAVMTDPALIAAAPKLGFDLDPKGIGSREDAARFLKAQLDLWNATTKQLNLLPE
ncbi:Bordetella uptake gene [Rhabdaerophilaceae bacterium]